MQTLGGLASEAPGTTFPSFHFTLNNTVIRDNRIPPYLLDHDEAKERNCRPVPHTLYGDPGAGGVYNHYDEIALNPPSGAARADIRLVYQTISFEYIQFLYLANDGSVPFLASAGLDLAKAWYQTGMSTPEIMAQISWP